MITKEQRLTAYQTADPSIQTLYSSPVADALNKEITEKYHIINEKKVAFLDTTGDVILGFYKVADLPRLLQTQVGMTPENAQRLVSDIIEFLTPVIEREAAEADSKKDELNALANKIAAIPPPDVAPEDLNFLSTDVAAPSIPAATPEVHAAVKPIRTMQTDMGKVHGYGALPQYQETEEEGIVRATPQDEIRPTK